MGYRPHVFRELGAEVIRHRQYAGRHQHQRRRGCHAAAGPVARSSENAIARISALPWMAMPTGWSCAMRTARLFDGRSIALRHGQGSPCARVLRGGVAGTLMTNFALLEQLFTQMAIPFGRAKVGDRYILEMLRKRTGKSAARIRATSCAWKNTTGDGIISALQVLGALRRANQSLRDFTAELTLFPQVLENVRTAKRFDFAGNAAVRAAVKAAETDLKGDGACCCAPQAPSRLSV